MKRRSKTLILNILLLFFTIIIILSIFEITITYIIPHNSLDNPKWLPFKYKKEIRERNLKHHKIANKNLYDFNDPNYSRQKPKNVDFRIAVLGDSFIFGDGVEDSTRWTKKLFKLLNATEDSVEIMSWGKSGWSTADQFSFLKEVGISYDFDLLIFAFVINDPGITSVQPKNFIQRDEFLYKFLYKIIGVFFPNTASFFEDNINLFFARYYDYGYSNWLNRIYEKDNLKRYDTLLQNVVSYCNTNRFNYFFVMTPESHYELIGKRFEIIEEIFRKNQIKYFNLFPIIKNKLGHLKVRELWANPADGHPNSLVTNIYASEIAKIINNYILQE